jgi:hypothetical protein
MRKKRATMGKNGGKTTTERAGAPNSHNRQQTRGQHMETNIEETKIEDPKIEEIQK